MEKFQSNLAYTRILGAQRQLRTDMPGWSPPYSGGSAVWPRRRQNALSTGANAYSSAAAVD